MDGQLLHVFRNTPLGRETLMQSAYFCQQADIGLSLYIPEHPQFLMYFDQAVVTVDLDRAFLRSPATALAHAEEILAGFRVEYSRFVPSRFTGKEHPELPTTCSYMCCPRSISDLSTKIGLGYIGPRVRNIVKEARFPVLISPPVFKEWRSIVCFFGGSEDSTNALKCSLDLASVSGVAFRLFTQAEGKSRESYEQIMEASGVLERMKKSAAEWMFMAGGDFRENLYNVPHDALVVVGAYGHGLGRQLLFGSVMETIQTVLPNPMLIVGPNWRG